MTFRHTCSITLAVSMFVAAFGAGLAGADDQPDSRAWPNLGSSFEISDTDAATDYPAVAFSAASNRYLVVWVDGRNKVGVEDTDIYGRIVKPDGTPVGSDFQISGPGATDTTDQPAVAYDPASNRFLVVWADWRNKQTRGSDIYGRWIKPNGKPAGRDFRIVPRAAKSHCYQPSVAFNAGNDQLLVAWSDARHPIGAAGWDIRARRVLSGGRTIGPEILVSGPGAFGDESYPAVASNGNGYLVVWMDGRNKPARGWDIYGRRVKPGGATAGGDFRISGLAATSDDWTPDVAHNSASNQYLVVWSDGRNDPARGSDIYGQKVKANGSFAGLDFRITDALGISDEWAPAVAYNSASGKWRVVWTDDRNLHGTSGRDIYSRRVKPGGTPAGAAASLISDSENYERDPAIACIPGVNRCLVPWRDNREPGIDPDIYGRRVAG